MDGCSMVSPKMQDMDYNCHFLHSSHKFLLGSREGPPSLPCLLELPIRPGLSFSSLMGHREFTGPCPVGLVRGNARQNHPPIALQCGFNVEKCLLGAQEDCQAYSAFYNPCFPSLVGCMNFIGCCLVGCGVGEGVSMQ